MDSVLADSLVLVQKRTYSCLPRSRTCVDNYRRFLSGYEMIHNRTGTNNGRNIRLTCCIFIAMYYINNNYVVT